VTGGPCYSRAMMRSKGGRWHAVLALGAVLLAALGGCRQGAAARGDTDGQALYAELCQRCHGSGGVPTPPMVARHGVKDLTSAEVQAGMSDDELREQIVYGSRNRQMPAFGGAISDDQIDAVIEYVRTLGP
jgi:mono/diheme cytochrome c family protein